MTFKKQDRSAIEARAAYRLVRQNQVRDFFSLGMTYSEIGAKMGCSKNTVTGIAHRMKLPLRETPKNIKKNHTRPPPDTFLPTPESLLAVNSPSADTAEKPLPTMQNVTPISFRPEKIVPLMVRRLASIPRRSPRKMRHDVLDIPPVPHTNACCFPMWADGARRTPRPALYCGQVRATVENTLGTVKLSAYCVSHHIKTHTRVAGLDA